MVEESNGCAAACKTVGSRARALVLNSIRIDNNLSPSIEFHGDFTPVTFESALPSTTSSFLLHDLAYSLSRVDALNLPPKNKLSPSSMDPEIHDVPVPSSCSTLQAAILPSYPNNRDHWTNGSDTLLFLCLLPLFIVWLSGNPLLIGPVPFIRLLCHARIKD